MDRRDWLTASAALLAATPLQPLRAKASGPVVGTLRVAFTTAETGFDPAQVPDINSGMVVASIFESPLTFDHLARPVKLRLQTAAAMPEVSGDAGHAHPGPVDRE